MKRRTKNYQSKDSNSKYAENWEQTFGKHQNDLDEYIKEKSENNPRFNSIVNELVERKAASVIFGDMCEDCKNHLSECDCEEETEFDKEFGEGLLEKSDVKIKRTKINYIGLFEFIILKIKDFYRWLIG